MVGFPAALEQGSGVRGSKGSAVFKKNFEELEKYDAPNWLKVDRKKMTIEVIALPDSMHFEQAVVPQMIVEFYSR